VQKYHKVSRRNEDLHEELEAMKMVLEETIRENFAERMEMEEKLRIMTEQLQVKRCSFPLVLSDTKLMHRLM
jgi:regulator of replication initiation timing